MVVIELTVVSEGHVTADVGRPLVDRAGCEAARRSLVVPTVDDECYHFRNSFPLFYEFVFSLTVRCYVK